MLKLKQDFVCLETPSKQTLDVSKCGNDNIITSIINNSNATNNPNNNKSKRRVIIKMINICKSHIYGLLCLHIA